MTLWVLRRLRCWWKGCDTRRIMMPFGRDGAATTVGWWCIWCDGTTILDERDWA